MQYKAYSRHMTHFLPLLAVLVSTRAQRFYCLAVIVIVFSKRSRAGNKRSFRFPFIDAFAINIVLSLSVCLYVLLRVRIWRANNGNSTIYTMRSFIVIVLESKKLVFFALFLFNK